MRLKINCRGGILLSFYVKYKVVIKDFKILEIEDEIISDNKICYTKEHIIEDEIVTLTILLQKYIEDNIFILQITSDKSLCSQQLIPMAQKEANNLLNKIVFYFENAKISEPWIIDAKFDDKKIAEAEIPCSIFISTENRDKKLLENLCERIKDCSDFNGDEYNLFKSAMNNEDVVVKYMFLYQILLFKHLNPDGYESQKLVDDFITSKFTEDKHQYKEWDDTERTETVYTRLRNQVGHFRCKTSQETRDDMKRKIYELIELVKLSMD